jgi:hypothetical protein
VTLLNLRFNVAKVCEAGSGEIPQERFAVHVTSPQVAPSVSVVANHLKPIGLLSVSSKRHKEKRK